MTTKIYLAKYIPDPARWEPRNVGVVIQDESGYSARFIGEKPSGAIDGRQVRYAIGAPADAYREWVRFWRRTIEEGKDPLDLVTRSGSDFFIAEAGEMLLEAAERTLAEKVQEYFNRLVKADAAPAEAELRHEVEQLLTVSGLANQVEIKRDVTLPSKGVRGEEAIKFAYGFQNGHLVVGHRVPIGIETMVHDALYRYIAVGDDVRKVSFVSGFEGGSKHVAALANLPRYSTVIDVGAQDAATKLEEALAAR